MSRKKVSATCRLLLSALLASALAASPAWAQARPRPLDAVLGVFFAADTATVESYLLEITKAQLQELEPAERQEFLAALMISHNLENREGLRVERVNQGNILLRVQKPGSNQSYVVNLANEQVEGEQAVVSALVRGSGPEPVRVVIRLGWENGGWRLAQFEFLSPNGRSFGMQLDDPGFVAGPMGPRQAANEASAVASLRNYVTACMSYFCTRPDDLGYPARLSLLGPEGENLVEAVLAPAGGGNTATRSGYEFTYSPGVPDTGGRINTFTVSARPIKYGVTGERSFFIDESGIIRFTPEDRAATAADPPLQ